MRLGVEIRGLEKLDHPRQGLAALEEDRAQHRALGVQVVRRDPRRHFETTHARTPPRIIDASSSEAAMHVNEIQPRGAFGESSVDIPWISRRKSVDDEWIVSV